MLKKKIEKDIEKDGEITHHFEEGSHIVKRGDWVNVEDLFVTAPKLKEKYGKDFKLIPPAAIGVYTYIDRLTQGLQQLMAGARKFALKYITREDICALTREAAEMSGITYVMDADRKEAEKIFPSVLVPSPLDKIYIDPISDSAKSGNFGWGSVRMEGIIGKA